MCLTPPMMELYPKTVDWYKSLCLEFLLLNIFVTAFRNILLNIIYIMLYYITNILRVLRRYTEELSSLATSFWWINYLLFSLATDSTYEQGFCRIHRNTHIFVKFMEIHIILIPFCEGWVLLTHLPAFSHSALPSLPLVSLFKKFWPGPRFCLVLIVFISFEKYFKNLGKKCGVLLNG